MAAQPATAKDAPVLGQSSIGWMFLSVTRIFIGWVFLWAFLDKLLALGYGTGRDRETGEVDVLGPRAWVNGAHVTEGYLGNASGPMGDFFQGWADVRFFDWVFMIGLLGIGLALILGIGTKIAAVSATAMLMLMYLANFDNANNPFMDDHIIYSTAALGIVWVELGRQDIGLGKWWRNLPIVKKNTWLV